MSRYDDTNEDRLYDAVYYEMLDARTESRMSWDRILEIVFDAIREVLYPITKED